MFALEDLTNEQLTMNLLRDEYGTLLEEAVAKEADNLRRLQFMKKAGALSVGKTLSPAELQLTFKNVKKEVDTFLRVTNISEPSCEYFSLHRAHGILVSASYFAGAGLLMANTWLQALGLLIASGGLLMHRELKKTHYSYNLLTLDPRINYTEIISQIGHEYDHHIQKEKWVAKAFYLKRFRMLREGHARGVERAIARQYAKKEGNPAFLFGPTLRTLAELISSYSWVCDLTDRKPLNDSLVNAFMNQLDKGTIPSEHARGNSLFYLWEKEQGQELYAKLLQETSRPMREMDSSFAAPDCIKSKFYNKTRIPVYTKKW